MQQQTEELINDLVTAVMVRTALAEKILKEPEIMMRVPAGVEVVTVAGPDDGVVLRRTKRDKLFHEDDVVDMFVCDQCQQQKIVLWDAHAGLYIMVRFKDIRPV